MPRVLAATAVAKWLCLSALWTPGRMVGHAGQVVCQGCRYQASITAGTIFQGTHKPLRLWFRAIWQVTSQKNGASALNLQQVLGLGSYLTAWTWLHKLRRAMVRPGRDCLSGRVEVDETYVGGESKGKGRSTDKALVVIAVEEAGSGMGRIRMARIADVTRKSLPHFIQASIQPGTPFIRMETRPTPGWRPSVTHTRQRCC